MKKFEKIIVCVVTLFMVSLMFFGCSGNTDKKYFENVSNYSFWDNKGSESIAQYKYFNIMDDFLKDGVIVNGHVQKDGKTKKIAFVGWDGARADSLINILHDNNPKTNDGLATPEFSGLNTIKQNGGKVYLAYCGGEKGKDTQQDTSTSAGWTSEFTGAWSKYHGVIDNNHIKNMEYKTIFLSYAEKGLHTGLGFAWGDYFDIALKEEVKYLLANKNIPMILSDIDRKPATSLEEAASNEKRKSVSELTTDSLELYNAVSKSNISKNVPCDSAMRDYILERISANDDIVAGIFDSPDNNGHTDTFSNSNYNYVNAVRNADQYLYQIINVISEREKNNNEEWLILVANDHGGSGWGHGKQVFEHRTNWVACNKAIDSKYFGVDYNGYQENN